MSIKGELTEKATEYFNTIPELAGKVPPAMLIDFVIEKYRQHRNYPHSFTDIKIEDDMRANVTTMAMAVVDLFLKTGANGQLSHSENGIIITYENAYISKSIFNDVLPYVDFF